jgi:hypothetical protein
VVVADAAILPADNLAALELAGFGFIVAPKNTSADKDLAGLLESGTLFVDG